MSRALGTVLVTAVDPVVAIHVRALTVAWLEAVQVPVLAPMQARVRAPTQARERMAAWLMEPMPWAAPAVPTPIRLAIPLPPLRPATRPAAQLKPARTRR